MNKPAQIDALETNPGTATNKPVNAGYWLNAVSHLLPQYGGISSAVPQLSSAVAAAGAHRITVAGFCLPGEFQIPAGDSAVRYAEIPFSRGAWYRDSSVRDEFRRLVRAAAGVHIHGLWDQSTNAAARTAFQSRKPFLTSAHGMLERWALQNKGLKKQVYLALVERKNLERAACLHALTQAEVDDYRRLGLRNPVAVIPNGVQIPSSASPSTFFNQYPLLRGKRIVLFLGRIHFKKGLDILCQAWARVSASWPEAELVLAGPDFEDTRPKIEQLVASLNISDKVTFTGMLNGELKWSALAAASTFILPSYSEGLSVSVLEAMGMGLPVIVTEQCNLPEVGRAGCGWVIQSTASEVERALLDVAHASRSALAELGANGRRLVRTRYSWPAAGEQFSSLYSWIEKGCPANEVPATVDVQSVGERAA